ncbi:sugar-binding domain-containing protein [Sphaerisporangium sp. NPDC088356]|uniref:sugar-binding transcriptional regulator n=1 Tax=Sphaerisporangium sp. NPDC088356 TaxID=3154871 RepID=UPI00343F4D45
MSNFSAHMSAIAKVTPAERRLMATVARRFYIDDVSKVEIAKELGLSRFKIARLLEQAKSTGIVTITLRDAGCVDDVMSAQLSTHMRLREAIVVETLGTDVQVRDQVGAAAATLLTETLHAGDVLGLAWGRTLTAMTEGLTSLPPVSVVQLTGAVGSDLAESPVEVVRKASLSAGGKAHPIFAPLVVEDAATAAALRRQTDVAAAMRLFARVTVAVVAVGSWNPPISQLREVMSEADRAELATRGVQAEVAGILIDRHGRLVGEDFAERCLSISAQELRRVPRVIAVAAGADKAQAVLAVARSGLLSSLVTDRALAEAVLSEPYDHPAGG